MQCSDNAKVGDIYNAVTMLRWVIYIQCSDNAKVGDIYTMQ